MADTNSNCLAESLLEVHKTLGWMDLVLGSITDGVCVTDIKNHLVFANDSFANLVDIQRVFLLGQKLETVFPFRETPHPLSEYRMTPNKLVVGDGCNGIFEWTDTRGSELIFRITSRYLSGTNQTVYLIQNITREYELIRMKNRFIDLASHQLRTPMTSIMTYAHMLQDGFAGELLPDQIKVTNTIINSSERMISLVNNLLSITRAQNDLRKFKYIKVFPAEILGKIQTELDPKLRQKNIDLVLNTTDETLNLESDISVIHEVFSNLIVNAVQYTNESGRITVNVSKTDDKIIITFTDTGIGIPEAYIPQIFDQFSRADNALEKYPEGTGLGLYLIKILLGKIGGSIACRSTLNVGSCFTVTLPLCPKPELIPQTKAAA